MSSAHNEDFDKGFVFEDEVEPMCTCGCGRSRHIGRAHNFTCDNPRHTECVGFEEVTNGDLQGEDSGTYHAAA